MDERWKLLLDGAFARVGKPAPSFPGRGVLGWSWCLTPALPSCWPPVRGARLVLYAYATGFAPTLADGVYVAAPWSRLLAEPHSAALPLLEPLGESLTELGIQGVRPLSGADLAAAPASTPALDVLVECLTHPESADTRREALASHYRFWAAHNGVIACDIAPRHQAFFTWLDVTRTV